MSNENDEISSFYAAAADNNDSFQLLVEKMPRGRPRKVKPPPDPPVNVEKELAGGEESQKGRKKAPTPETINARAIMSLVEREQEEPPQPQPQPQQTTQPITRDSSSPPRKIVRLDDESGNGVTVIVRTDSEGEGDDANDNEAQAFSGRPLRQVRASMLNEPKKSEKVIDSRELRKVFSADDLQVIYEAMISNGGAIDADSLSQLLPGKSQEDIDSLLRYCSFLGSQQYNRGKLSLRISFDFEKATTPLEHWLQVLDDLTAEDTIWARKAYALAVGILGRYEEPSFPPLDANGDVPPDEPNYGAIYEWLSALMLNVAEQPRPLRPIDAMIVLDMLEHVQGWAEIRLSQQLPPLDLLQRKHLLLTTGCGQKFPQHAKRMAATQRRIGLALAKEDQCDLSSFTDKEMISLIRLPPVNFENPSTSSNVMEEAGSSNFNDPTLSSSAAGAAHGDDRSNAIRKPPVENLQAFNPFRLSARYSRLDYWSIAPAATEDDAITPAPTAADITHLQ